MNENTMTIYQLKEEIIALIGDSLGVDTHPITLETNLETDLGADSLDTVELIMGIESKYGVIVSDDDAAAIKTVGDAVQFVHAELSKN